MSAKNLFKRLFKTEAFRKFICFAAASYIRFVYYTSRKRIDIDEAAKPYANGERNAVFAFWHGRMLLIPMISPRTRKVRILISTHRDGEMITRTLEHFGVGAVRGSSTRGGALAASAAVRALAAGDSVAVTPDGPRGPVMVLQPGLLRIAELAGVPVVPVTYGARRHKRMRSWDRFLLALPFTTIYYKVGAPMTGADKETLERCMVQQTKEVDAM